MSRKNASGLNKAIAPTEDPLAVLLESPGEETTSVEESRPEEATTAFEAELPTLEIEGDPTPAPLERRRRSPAAGSAAGPEPAGGTLGLGWLLLIAGLALSGIAAFDAVPALSTLIGKGLLAGTSLLAAGIVLLAAAGCERRQHESSAMESQRREEALAELGAGVDELVAHQRALAERPPQNDTEALERATLAIQRQDEKIANLSKALKMYGKPLMDISQQTTEIGQLVGDLGQTLQATKTITEQGPTRVETVLRAQLDGFESRQTAHLRQSEEIATSARTQQQNLLQLQKDSRDAIQRHLALEQLVHGLEKQIAGVTQGIEKLASMKPSDDDKSLTQLDKKLTEVREALLQQFKRDMAGVQTQIARVHAVAQNVATNAAPAAAQSTPVPAEAPVAISGSAMASTSTSEPGAIGPGGLAQSIAGEKKTESKNVLGAIAKLKNMRK